MAVLPLPLFFALSLLAVGTSSSGGAALGLDELLSDARKIEEWIINIRRELHQHPELMFQVRVYMIVSSFVYTCLFVLPIFYASLSNLIEGN
jgi:hypothetical protein